MVDAVVELRRRADARWLRRVLVPIVIAVLATAFLQPFLFLDDRRHHSFVCVLVGAVVGALVAAAILAVGLRRQRRRGGQGWLSAPLTAGSSWRARRAVGRAVRRGRPSSDPVMRAAEEDCASRLIRERRRTLILFAVLTVAFAAVAVLADLTTLGRVYFVAATIGCVWTLAWSGYVQRGAAAYLTAVGE